MLNMYKMKKIEIYLDETLSNKSSILNEEAKLKCIIVCFFVAYLSIIFSEVVVIN